MQTTLSGADLRWSTMDKLKSYVLNVLSIFEAAKLIKKSQWVTPCMKSL